MRVLSITRPPCTCSIRVLVCDIATRSKCFITSWAFLLEAALSPPYSVVKVRPRSTTLRPHSEARARPASAPPPARVKRRSPSSASKRNHPAVLIPSLPNTSIVGKVSRAELEAWATLRSITEEEPHVRSARRHRESRPMVVTFDRARPNSTSEQYSSYDRTDGAPFDRQRPTKVVKKPRGFDVFCVEQLDGCTPTCAEHDALRQRQKERDRSDISVR